MTLFIWYPGCFYIWLFFWSFILGSM